MKHRVIKVRALEVPCSKEVYSVHNLGEGDFFSAIGNSPAVGRSSKILDPTQEFPLERTSHVSLRWWSGEKAKTFGEEIILGGT